MKPKSRKPVRKPTLQEFVLVPISDPAEQAALDRRCDEAEKTLAASSPDSRQAHSAKRK
jgi:hypothetical protein